MSLIHILIVVTAGLLAGIANVIAGAGSLITYPVLVSVGLPPVVANMSNDIGITTGNLSGVIAVRKDLKGNSRTLIRKLPIAILGSIFGASLLIFLPSHIFQWVAPFMLLIASLLTLAKSWVMAHNVWLEKLPFAYETTIFLIATYGGYFGAGIGLLFMAAVSIFEKGHTQQLNAYKNVYQFVSNGIAGLIFIFIAQQVNWLAALIMAAGALVGAQIGAQISHHISANMLRWVISILGMLAAIAMFVENFIH